MDPITKQITEADIRRAVAGGRKAAVTEFRASAVRYDPARDLIELALGDAVEVRLKRSLIQEFEGVPVSEMRAMTLSPAGTTLILDQHDVHISVDGLMASLVSPKAIAKLFAARGGKSASTAKQRAARRNGARGGRPRKFAAD
jgi:hypothetical protein